MAKKIFTFAAVFAFFLGCADVPEELRDEAEGKCSGRAYTEYQFCAGGQVYDFCDGTPYNPSIVGCCNNHQYTISTEFCSQNYIYRRCGGNSYTPETEFCSGDGVHDKCNGQSYTPSTQFCGYNGGGYGVYNKCGGEEYSPSSQGCQNGAVMNKCGSNYYNPSTQFCEDNKIYNKCSGNTYSPSSQRCQSGVIETKCGDNWYNYNFETQFCGYDDVSVYKVYDKCGGEKYWPSYQRCQGDVVETKCGNEWYDDTNTNLRCYASVVETKCGSGWYDASNTSLRCQSSVIEAKCGTNNWYRYNDNTSTQYCSDGMLKNYGSVTDDGGKTYKTVVIGTQTWMAENLNYAASGSKCGDENYIGGDVSDANTPTCEKYGRLYDWATAMGISSTYNSSLYNPSASTKYRGVCPSGWHIPNNDELTTLTDFVGGSFTAGTKLRAKSGWGGSGNGTDDYGFSALPGGYGFSGGSFGDAGQNGFWWGAKELNASNASLQCIYYEHMWWGGGNDKAYFHSVRCVQD
jgi:uncharacterized protein (TIGR02145 family)